MPDKSRRHYYIITNNRSGIIIGYIQYYHFWRRYVFCPQEGSIWSADCMDFVSGFIKGLKK